jgi:hypothetical protein
MPTKFSKYAGNIGWELPSIAARKDGLFLRFSILNVSVSTYLLLSSFHH